DSLPTSESPNGQVAVQLIDGTDFIRRTTFTDKPLSGVFGVWFGKAADSFERMVFRGGTSGGNAFLFQATFHPRASRFHLHLKTIHTGPAGFHATSSGAGVSTSAFLSGINDFVLYASWSTATDGGLAQSDWLDPNGDQPIVGGLLHLPIVTTYAGGNGFIAT